MRRVYDSRGNRIADVLGACAADPYGEAQAINAFPDAGCHKCRHFRGFSSIVPPDFDPGASARCSRLKPVPLAILNGDECREFSAGEHWEYT